MRRVRHPVRGPGSEGPVDRVEAVGRQGFGWALAVALVAHAVIIGLLVTGIRRNAAPPIDWVELMPEGTLLGGGTPAAAAEDEASPPPRTSPAPQPEMAPPPSAVAPEPKLTPAPEPAPPPEPAPIPKPETRVPPKPPEPRPQPKKKEPIKVSLKEVSRPSPGQATKAPPVVEAATGPATDATEVRDRLQKRLGKMGVSGATSDGPSGVPGGTASGEIAAYYARIRDVYYNAWRQPGIPGREKLSAVVRVRIAKDGSVLGADIERGSGNGAMDDTVRAATAAVREIGQPLPQGLGSQFAEVTITFEF